MLKLTRGQLIKKKNQSTPYFIVEVLENLVYVTTQQNMMSENVYLYTNERFLYHFDYKEPFEPNNGDAIWYLSGTVPSVTQGLYDVSGQYLFNRVFKTKEDAEEFCNKVNAI